MCKSKEYVIKCNCSHCCWLIFFFVFFIFHWGPSSIKHRTICLNISPFPHPSHPQQKKKEEKENTHAHTYTCTHTSSKKSSNTWFGFGTVHIAVSIVCSTKDVGCLFFCFLFFNLLSLWGTFVLLYCIHFCINSRWRRGLLFCIPKLTDQKKKHKKKHTHRKDRQNNSKQESCWCPNNVTLVDWCPLYELICLHAMWGVSWMIQMFVVSLVHVACKYCYVPLLILQQIVVVRKLRLVSSVHIPSQVLLHLLW